MSNTIPPPGAPPVTKWFRAEAHGPVYGMANHGISGWYLAFEAAERAGTAWVQEGAWTGFRIVAVYSIDEPQY